MVLDVDGWAWKHQSKVEERAFICRLMVVSVLRPGPPKSEIIVIKISIIDKTTKQAFSTTIT